MNALASIFRKVIPWSGDPDEREFGIDTEGDLQYLLDECKARLKKFDEDLIRRAFRYCVQAHANDIRADGKPYYTHLLAVALIVLREIPLDDVSVAAALLHDVVEDHEHRFSLKDIRGEFGPVVETIVDGVTKIRDISLSRELNQAESYRKLLISLVKDVRVILIKFADRLHNMRTLDHLPLEKQQRIAKETIEIYAPFAHRFGLGKIKWELEDLSFKYLDRSNYDGIKRLLNSTRSDRQSYIDSFVAPIVDRLKEHNIKCDISGRPKHIFSIHNKMVAREKSFQEIYDLFAIRIILETTDKNECFFVYGVVSEIYTPVPERFKDYISVPKKNGYQSLHTTVIGPDGKRVEIQIRTRTMHEIAESGVAAHFRYKNQAKNGRTAFDRKDLEEWADWMRGVFINAGDEAVHELLESFQLNLYQQEIQIFTPKGDLRTLPTGATALDFAFEIHSDIGRHCVGAKVNGKLVPLDFRLQTGDQIEIITSRTQNPGKDWERIVVTHKAKAYIRKYFNEEKRRKTSEGRDLWDKKSKKAGLHIDEDDLDKIIMSLRFEHRFEFYYKIGIGELEAETYIDLVKDKIKPGAGQADAPNPEANFDVILKSARESAAGVAIGTDPSVNGLVYSYARCCNPIPGDQIIGIVTTGTGIKVHRTACRNLAQLQRKMPGRNVDLRWANHQNSEFIAAVRITGEDRPGMLNDITQAIVGYQNTNIKSVNIHANDSVFEGIFTILVRNTEYLQRVFDRIRKIRGVEGIERFEG